MPDWPHAPVHRLNATGAYMVTAGIYRKERLLSSPARLELVRDALFTLAGGFGWQLQAWAIMANHYHFVAISSERPEELPVLISRLHMQTAKELNRQDATPGRRVWFQFWDSHITFERSYLARLNYVCNNPVHHGAAESAVLYPWCSAAWFARTADPAFVKTVAGFKTDGLNVRDDF